jgi:hypothetical protein
MLLAVVLSLSPWHGPDLPSAPANAVKYRLSIHGAPGAHVHLRTSGVARGWLAAFCTSKICSPGQTWLDLPKSGSYALQFELIRQLDNAPTRSGARIFGDDGSAVTVRRTR